MSTKTPNSLQRRGGTNLTLVSDVGKALNDRGKDVLDGQSTYYNLPLIKKAHWTWEVILYFFLGGIAGGSFLAATLADLLGTDEDAELVRAGRYLSLACLMISPILLIKDLGRPARFHHMLRVLKFRSAMSLGTWGLSFFGVFCGVVAVYQAAKDGLFNWFPPLARLVKAFPVKFLEGVGSFFGLFVASYTGVLLAATAVPIWARARYILGPLFLSSGLSTALASLSLILSLGRSQRGTLERIERAEVAAITTELSLITAVLPILGPLARPLFKGKIGILFTGGTIGGGLMLPLLTRLASRLSERPLSRPVRIGNALLTLIGGLILRYTWIVVGRASANDPLAVHYYNAIEWKNKRHEGE